jgi:hypothetical protein
LNFTPLPILSWRCTPLRFLQQITADCPVQRLSSSRSGRQLAFPPASQPLLAFDLFGGRMQQGGLQQRHRRFLFAAALQRPRRVDCEAGSLVAGAHRHGQACPAAVIVQPAGKLPGPAGGLAQVVQADDDGPFFAQFLGDRQRLAGKGLGFCELPARDGQFAQVVQRQRFAVAVALLAADLQAFQVARSARSLRPVRW